MYLILYIIIIKFRVNSTKELIKPYEVEVVDLVENTTMSQHHQQLEKLYFTPIEPSSFGVQPLIELSKLDKNVVKEWLPSQNAYTLHKPVRKFFLRNKTIVPGIDDQWQADLVDMMAYA